jgi:hypothetical protein
MSAAEQQINLYQQQAGKGGGAGPFSARTAAKLAVAVSGCMLAFWGYGLWHVKLLERAVSALRQQQQRQQDTMAALNAARDLGTSPEQIDARIKELAAELEARSHALEMLRDGSVGQTDGFSRRLAALAGHPVEGLWLDHVLLSGMTRSMALGGVAVTPELIPRYLRGLSADGALTGVRFGELVIERPSAVPAEPAESKPQPGAVSRQAFKFRAEGQSASPPTQDSTS